MNHTQLLNYLADKHQLKSYLEIGVQYPSNNFDRINCKEKWGVDPAVATHNSIAGITSDKYFETVGLGRKYDLVFIDGLHICDQVKRDFENSLRCLNDNGFIVIHDCLPEDEITTCVPRGEQKMWHGDVFKWAMTLKGYDGIDFITYNFDNGCCVVWKDATKKGRPLASKMNWKTYKSVGHGLMNVQDGPVRI